VERGEDHPNVWLVNERLLHPLAKFKGSNKKTHSTRASYDSAYEGALFGRIFVRAIAPHSSQGAILGTITRPSADRRNRGHENATKNASGDGSLLQCFFVRKACTPNRELILHQTPTKTVCLHISVKIKLKLNILTPLASNRMQHYMLYTVLHAMVRELF
jgi:hypothetical protein